MTDEYDIFVVKKKHWFLSKSIIVQALGLVGMILIGLGIIGEETWAKYLGYITTALGIAVRFVTKGAVTW